MIATDETYYLERKAERTCEILADLADDTLPVNQSIMYLKITSTSVSNIKGLEYNLSRLCGMDLHLLDCELGDINNEVVFRYFKELSITSIEEQVEELAKMGLQWMLCKLWAQ